MKKIALITKNKLFAESLIAAVNNMEDSNLKIYMFFDEKQALIDAEIFQVDIALVDFSSGNNNDCFLLCEQLHKIVPKIALLLSQEEPKRYEILRLAREKGYIEDFLLYDTSLKYLIAKLSSL